jgi:uncharacterized membrane protein YebE (DUF533 family)
MDPQAPSKNDWITTASIAAFILLALGVVGFLYYQNQQLKKIVAGYQATPSSVPTPIEVIQSASPSATPKTNSPKPSSRPVATPSIVPIRY